jgi:hypothetical protein
MSGPEDADGSSSGVPRGHPEADAAVSLTKWRKEHAFLGQVAFARIRTWVPPPQWKRV